MKQAAGVLFMGLVIAAPAIAGIGVWTPIGGPEAPAAHVVVDPGHPQTVYALVAHEPNPQSAASLWKSTDGGETWKSIQEQIGGPVASLVIDPLRTERLYAWRDAESATNFQSQLWVSEDAGESWELRYLQSQSAPSARLRILPSPVQEGILYGWTDGSNFDTALYRSIDGGATWTLRRDVGDIGTILSLSFNPARNLLDFFDAGGFYVSADEGLTWTRRGQYRGVGFLTVARSGAAPDRLYARPSLPHVCLVRSDDGGATWRKLPPPKLPKYATCSDIAVDPADPDLVRLVALGEAGRQFVSLVATSRDGGQTWSQARPFPAISVVPTAADPDTLFGESVYPFQRVGLFKTTDNGRSWTTSATGIVAGDLRPGLVALPGAGRGPLLVALHNGRIVRSVDGGRTWTTASQSLSGFSHLAVDAGGQILYARRFDDGRLVRSLDRGATWRETAVASFRLGDLHADPYRSGRLFVSISDFAGSTSETDVFRTLDAATLTPVSTGLPVQCSHIASVDYCPGILAQTSDPRQSERVLLAFGDVNFFASSAPVFVSTDGGTSWHEAAQSPPAAVFSLAADPGTAGVFLAGTSTGAIYRSEDGGEHWTAVGSGLPVESPVGQLLRDGRSGAWYAVTQSKGIFRSSDGGRTWSPTGPGLPDPFLPRAVLDPEMADRLIVAVRGQGVWSWSAPGQP